MRRGFGLAAVGMTVMAMSNFADLIAAEHKGFGPMQLFGLVIGAFVTMVGFGKILLIETQKIARVLAGVYLSGVLYLGLKPQTLKAVHGNTLFGIGSINWGDFIINTVGFVLLGYLFMSSFRSRPTYKRADLLQRAIFVAGVGGLISLFLEISQYYFVPGRYSSLFDWIANTLGTLLGVTIYLFLYRLDSPPHTFPIGDR